jgi:hypothetical protein
MPRLPTPKSGTIATDRRSGKEIVMGNLNHSSASAATAAVSSRSAPAGRTALGIGAGIAVFLVVNMVLAWLLMLGAGLALGAVYDKLGGSIGFDAVFVAIVFASYLAVRGAAKAGHWAATSVAPATTDVALCIAFASLLLALFAANLATGAAEIFETIPSALGAFAAVLKRDY